MITLLPLTDPVSSGSSCSWSLWPSCCTTVGSSVPSRETCISSGLAAPLSAIPAPCCLAQCCPQVLLLNRRCADRDSPYCTRRACFTTGTVRIGDALLPTRIFLGASGSTHGFFEVENAEKNRSDEPTEADRFRPSPPLESRHVTRITVLCQHSESAWCASASQGETKKKAPSKTQLAAGELGNATRRLPMPAHMLPATSAKRDLVCSALYHSGRKSIDRQGESTWQARPSLTRQRGNASWGRSQGVKNAQRLFPQLHRGGGGSSLFSFRVPSSSSSSSASLVVLLLGGVEGLVVGDVGDEGGEAETEAGEQVPEPGSSCIVAEVVAGQEVSQFRTCLRRRVCCSRGNVCLPP